jgi:hypothetical protein
MKKSMSMIWVSAVVAGLSFSAAGAIACDSHATKASAEGSTAIMKVSDGGSCATKVSTAGSGCGMKSSMASLLKSAPGTKMTYKKVDGGIALVVTAASKEYVPVVQQAIATRLDDMKVMTTHATKVSSGSSCCAAKTSAVKVSDGATCATKTSAVKVSDGATCATKSTAASSAGATVTTVSAENCPDWMKVLCSADCQVENTSTGVKVMWTTTEKTKIEQVQMAGEQLHADLAS